MIKEIFSGIQALNFGYTHVSGRMGVFQRRIRCIFKNITRRICCIGEEASCQKDCAG